MRKKTKKEKGAAVKRERATKQEFNASLDKFLLVLKDNPDISLQEAAYIMGITYWRVHWYMKTLRKRGLIIEKKRVIVGGDDGEEKGRKRKHRK